LWIDTLLGRINKTSTNGEKGVDRKHDSGDSELVGTNKLLLYTERYKLANHKGKQNINNLKRKTGQEEGTTGHARCDGRE